MVVINTISAKYFEFNGIQYARIYQPLKQGNEAIGIYNIFDTRQQLLNSTLYNEFTIDSVTYATQAETIAALLNVIYSSATGVVSEIVEELGLISSNLTGLISKDVKVYADPTDTDHSDGIDMIIALIKGALLTWVIEGNYYYLPLPETATLDTYPTSGSRIDAIYCDDSGTIKIQSGDVSETEPNTPALAFDQILIANVLVSSDETITVYLAENIVYISKAGKDTDGGRSINTPRLSISGAASILQAGDVLKVKDSGVYSCRFDCSNDIQAFQATLRNETTDTQPTVKILTNSTVKAKSIIARGSGDGATALQVSNSSTVYLNCDSIEGNIIVDSGSTLIVSGSVKQVSGINSGNIKGVISSVYNEMIELKEERIASTSTLVINTNAPFVTDSANEISRFNYADYKATPFIFIHLEKGTPLKHGEQPQGSAFGLNLSTEADHIVLETRNYLFILREINGVLYYEDGGLFKLQEEIKTVLPTVKLVQFPAYSMTTGGTITGLTTTMQTAVTVTNKGTATVTLTDSYIVVGAGTIYGIEGFDSSGTKVFEIPCAEGNNDFIVTRETVEGEILFISGAKTLTTQDVYLRINENGYTVVIDTDNTTEYYFNCYKNDKTKA